MDYLMATTIFNPSPPMAVRFSMLLRILWMVLPWFAGCCRVYFVRTMWTQHLFLYIPQQRSITPGYFVAYLVTAYCGIWSCFFFNPHTLLKCYATALSLPCQKVIHAFLYLIRIKILLSYRHSRAPSNKRLGLKIAIKLLETYGLQPLKPAP